MGKRKRREEDDEEELEEVVDPSSSSNWREESHSRPKANKHKRRREEVPDVYDDNTDTTTSTVPPLTNGSCSKDAKAHRLNGYLPDSGAEQEVWLVRKPINVSSDDLYRLRFSTKTKHHRQEVPTEGHVFECRLEKPTCTILHAAASADLPDQKETMQTRNLLRGIVWVNQSSTSGPAEEKLSSSDGIFVDEDDSAAKSESIQFLPIRRKPNAEDELVKERLTAYGLGMADDQQDEDKRIEAEDAEEVPQKKKRRKKIKC